MNCSVPEPMQTFDLDRSRSYWRHAPSGSGKADSTGLAALDDARLAAEWDRGFRERFLNYPEEEQFLRTFSESVKGQRVLSVGSGLGFHEIYYAAAGAAVTCADIVESNLSVIDRISRIKNLGPVRTCDVSASSIGNCGRGFDVVFIYGCLMHMPPDRQRALMDAARAALAAGGRLVLMVYSWEFVERLCGWTSPEQFDPALFARRSDPVVGVEACPWADWYDDGKLLALAPGMRVSRKQAWNDRQYVWYELSERAAGEVEPFFPAAALLAGRLIGNVPLRRFTAAEAQLRRSWFGGLEVTTTGRGAGYAAFAPAPDRTSQANAVSIAIDVHEGACSAGLLDDGRGVFAANAVAAARGRHQSLLLVPDWPDRCRIVFSNHQQDADGPSRFSVRRVALIRRPIAEPPNARTH
jgi:SAM-dependent methyltransferase